jgi:DNA-binding NarL/FixJ family response regulator
MRKIRLFFRDKAFSRKIQRVFPYYAELSRETEHPETVHMGSSTRDADLIIMDWSYIAHLREIACFAKVMMASDTYDRNREYLSARLGAKGFITKDMDALSIKKAVDTVNSGQVWMTRTVATRVFSEYKRIVQENKRLPEA